MLHAVFHFSFSQSAVMNECASSLPTCTWYSHQMCFPYSLQVTTWGVPPQEAIDITGATVTRRALGRRARRRFERFDPPVTDANWHGCEHSSLTLTDNPDSSSSAAGTTPTKESSSLTKARDAALDTLPDWMNKEKTENVMLKRKKRTTLEMNRDKRQKVSTFERSQQQQVYTSSSHYRMELSALLSWIKCTQSSSRPARLVQSVLLL